MNKHKLMVISVGTLFLALLNTIGYVTENSVWDNPFRVGISVVFFVGIGMLTYFMLIVLFYCIDNIKNKANPISRFEIMTISINLRWIFVFILIAWLPYCILHYPTRLGGGSGNQLRMFFGEETRAWLLSSVKYDGHYLVNHHPVLITLYYGFFWLVGIKAGNVDAAVFMLSCTNLIISVGAFTYMVCRIKKYLSPRGFMAILLFVALFPYYGAYAYTCCKDNLFGAALIIFYTLLMDMVLVGELSRHDLLVLTIVSAVIPFLKNQGIIIIVISLSAVCLCLREYTKQIIVIILLSAFVYIVLFSHVLMPLLKISPGGKQEALSVPFQQTAARFLYHPEDVSEYEYSTVDRLLPADIIAEEYDPERADAVKFQFKPQATNEELIEYAKVWLEGLRRHPLVYVRAWASMTDGYFYIFYEKINMNLSAKLDDYGAYNPDWVLYLIEKEKAFLERLILIPFAGQIFKNTFFSYAALLTGLYCWYSEKYKRLLVVLPVLLNFLVLLLCPANGMLRYSIPLIYALPIEYVLIVYKGEDRVR